MRPAETRPLSQPSQCGARTRSGAPCKSAPVTGRQRCRMHGGADGSGAPRIYPPLPGNANLQSVDPSSTLRIILDGAKTVTTPRAPNPGSMPTYAKQLSDQEIADVTNYIRHSWGNAAPLVTPAQVKRARMQQAPAQSQ